MQAEFCKIKYGTAKNDTNSRGKLDFNQDGTTYENLVSRRGRWLNVLYYTP